MLRRLSVDISGAPLKEIAANGLGGSEQSRILLRTSRDEDKSY